MSKTLTMNLTHFFWLSLKIADYNAINKVYFRFQTQGAYFHQNIVAIGQKPDNWISLHIKGY